MIKSWNSADPPKSCKDCEEQDRAPDNTINQMKHAGAFVMILLFFGLAMKQIGLLMIPLAYVYAG